MVFLTSSTNISFLKCLLDSWHALVARSVPVASKKPSYYNLRRSALWEHYLRFHVNKRSRYPFVSSLNDT